MPLLFESTGLVKTGIFILPYLYRYPQYKGRFLKQSVWNVKKYD
ncbi:hypothetical protein GbCGDNIH4_7259 [Granulibacter bethesdensis CGDNIH4]|nr:hypothetical protein GbCGDNIH4_7259 [Granulibacter bethesdensis CGDNIH4]